MADFLYSIDVWLFYLINNTISNPLFDKFFKLITEVDNWYIAYIVILGIAFFKGGKQGKLAVIGALLLITVSDQLSSFTIKNLVSRIRPCNVLPHVRTITGCTDSFSFPSSHAVNNFAMFVFFSIIYPNLKWILFVVAFLVSISRVYVGKHYPSDVAGGAIIGMAIGYVFAIVVMEINKWLEKKENKKNAGR
jgi:undecaprenyl-diphosphatase